MIQTHRFFIAPFLPGSYYLVIKAWLAEVRQPLALDVIELVNCAQIEDTAIVLFDGKYDLGLWVRRNPAGQPNLVSHVTFQSYFEAMVAGDEGGEERPLKRRSGVRDGYEIRSWPQIAESGVIYKPRAYLHNRWPLRLGRGNRAGRAALLALFEAMTIATPARAAQPVTQPITLRQIRGRAQKLLPGFEEGKNVGGSLRQLEQLGLITELHQVRHNTTYQLNLLAFERTPAIQAKEVAAACGLDAVVDKVWVDLVCAFLAAQLQPLEEAIAVWRQLRKRQRVLESAEDARRVTELVRQRQGNRSTGVARVLRDYQRQKTADKGWLLSHPFALALNPGGAVKTDDIRMPALGGADVHLHATQLLLSVQCGPKVTESVASAALQGARLWIMQGMSILSVTDNLRISPAMIEAQTILDCNHLHGQLDYAQPFSILLLDARTSAEVHVVGRFRVRHTLRQA